MDVCPSCDHADAATVRRRNLELVITAAIESGVDTMWVARDLGYRGGRRTGLALTDELHLSAHAQLMGTMPLLRATKGPAQGERTAAVIWSILEAIGKPVFLWNVFPLHPHKKAEPMSNRAHTRKEAAECRFLLDWLIARLSPKRVIAIGRDAQAALISLGINSVSVRHPSYGGQTEFIASMQSYYHLPDSPISNRQLSLL